ncbi:MAG: hypothetical protein U9R02_04795 [Thermodesulfobacteriota bacterium]|nr:hypothetical protein [Thermodesulfobacteriota bacterium]
MKILTPAITPHKLNHVLQIQKKAEFLPPLSVGEVVEAEVMETSRCGKTLISLKNSRLTADSELLLKKGEKIAVRVTQLHPGVILRIVQNERSQNSRLMDYLRFYRSNPKALFEFLIKGIDRFSPENLGELAAHLGKEDIENIRTILKSLIFSRENFKNPLFIKDYVSKFGYLMEKENASQNLKGLLTKIYDRLQLLMETRNLPAAEKLAGFIRSSLQIIDSHQVINYLFHEYEGKYMFQVPMLFPKNTGLAEIFVKFGDRDSKGKSCRKDKTVLFLLNMDALGDIIVEAKIKTKKISCILKCKDENICDFIRLFLEELGEKLKALGYDINYLTCVTEKDDLKIKAECREFQNLFGLESVDILA